MDIQKCFHAHAIHDELRQNHVPSWKLSLWHFFWRINTYHNKSKQVWKKVQRIQRYAKKMYSSIKRCNKNTSNHVFKNLSKEIFQKKNIKKHIKTSFFGFQPLSLGCGPLSLGRGPQDCKHKSGAVFTPKNQTPRLAGNVLRNVYLRFNIFSRNSQSYPIPEKSAVPKMFDHEEVYKLIYSV